MKIPLRGIFSDTNLVANSHIKGEYLKKPDWNCGTTKQHLVKRGFLLKLNLSEFYSYAALALHVTWHYTVSCNKQEFIMQANIAQRVQKHRAGLRAAGLRPVQIWVPDTRRSGFAEECRRQSLLLRGDALEADTLAWLETAADTDGWK